MESALTEELSVMETLTVQMGQTSHLAVSTLNKCSEDISSIFCAQEKTVCASLTNISVPTRSVF